LKNNSLSILQFFSYLGFTSKQTPIGWVHFLI